MPAIDRGGVCQELFPTEFAIPMVRPGGPHFLPFLLPFLSSSYLFLSPLYLSLSSTSMHARGSEPCRLWSEGSLQMLSRGAHGACMPLRATGAAKWRSTACTLSMRPAAVPGGYSLSVLRDGGHDGDEDVSMRNSPSGLLRERVGGRYLGPRGLQGPPPSAEPLQLPPPARRPFLCPPRRSASGKLLLVRPLAKPRFHARFGERPMHGMLLADATGLRVPWELRERAVLREEAGSQQRQPWQQQQGPPSIRPWQEDPELDLDELGDLVPQWACRLSRQQLLDHEAAETWRGLRAWR
jgi:hypothetical protein